MTHTLRHSMVQFLLPDAQLAAQAGKAKKADPNRLPLPGKVSLLVIMCVMDKEDKCLVFFSSFTSQGGFSLKCCPLHFFSLQAPLPLSLIQAGRLCLAL